VLLAGSACSSTDTTNPNDRASFTAETTLTTADALAVNPTGAGIRETLNEEITNMSDPMFLIDAASSGMMEVQLGQMAVQKATNAQGNRAGR
jgi:putative membrane protein